MSTGSERNEDGTNTPVSAGFARWVEQLAVIDLNAEDSELIDRISQLERLKSACAATQAILTAEFVRSQTEGLSAAKAKDERVHRSIAAQVALARRDSPVRGGRHVGLAKVLTREMPNTFSALQTGEISEWRATLMVRETACLSLEHRQQVDAELAGKLVGLGDRGTERAAAKIAQRLDAAACVKRHRKAVNERRVTIRPAPDTMTYVSALLPVQLGVAVYAALTKHADTARANGDPRGRGQVMADEFVARITQPAGAVKESGAAAEVTVDVAGSPGAPQNPSGPSTGERDGDQSAAGAEETVDEACSTWAPQNSSCSNTAEREGDQSAGAETEEAVDEASSTWAPQNSSCPNTAEREWDQSAGAETEEAVDEAGSTGAPQNPSGPNTAERDGNRSGAAGRHAPKNRSGAMAASSDAKPFAAPGADGAAGLDSVDSRPGADVPWAYGESSGATTTATTPEVVPAGVSIEIQLVMTDRTLFDGDNEPAHLAGYGPIPAPLARQLIRDASPKVKTWIRRLYTDPETGHLINGDARHRFFGHAERQFLIARDQFCRSPYCDAPIRHTDHVEGHGKGPADLTKGQGLCENCNYLKEAPGWTSRVEPRSNSITITTPTSHTHRTDPPDPPRSDPWARDESSSAAASNATTPRAEGLLATLLGRNAARMDIVFPEVRYGREFVMK